MGDEVDFLPANKQKGFLQVDSINLSLFIQACPKYPKQVYNIFIISMIKCFQITQSNKFAISLQYLKKEVRNGDQFLACR